MARVSSLRGTIGANDADFMLVFIYLDYIIPAFSARVCIDARRSGARRCNRILDAEFSTGADSESAKNEWGLRADAISPQDCKRVRTNGGTSNVFRKGKLGRRRVATDELPMHEASYRQARAHFGAIRAAPVVGGIGSLEEPAAAFLFHRPAFEGIDASAIVEHGSVLRRKHQSENPVRLRRVGGIVGAELKVA